MSSTHRFAIRAGDLPDTLVRVLGPFALRQARLVAVDHVIREGDAMVNLIVTGLGEGEAEHLRARLLAMPFVHTVQVSGTTQPAAGRREPGSAPAGHSHRPDGGGVPAAPHLGAR
jgi:hypothetical protein